MEPLHRDTRANIAGGRGESDGRRRPKQHFRPYWSFNSCGGDDPRLFNGLALSGQFGFCKRTRAFKWFRWIDFRSDASELPAITRRRLSFFCHPLHKGSNNEIYFFQGIVPPR
jgi:hypothetical protein